MPVRAARAKLAMARGDASGALAALEGATAQTRDEERLLAATNARALFRSGRYDAAEAAARKVLGTKDGLAADATTVLGLCRALVGDDAAARAYFDEAVKLATALDDARARVAALAPCGRALSTTAWPSRPRVHATRRRIVEAPPCFGAAR